LTTEAQSAQSKQAEYLLSLSLWLGGSVVIVSVVIDSVVTTGIAYRSHGGNLRCIAPASADMRDVSIQAGELKLFRECTTGRVDHRGTECTEQASEVPALSLSLWLGGSVVIVSVVIDSVVTTGIA
jgi:hypothetical protein